MKRQYVLNQNEYSTLKVILEKIEANTNELNRKLPIKNGDQTDLNLASTASNIEKAKDILGY